DGRIMEFNREAVRVLGWPTGEAIGQDYLRLCVPASWRDMVGAGIRRALKGESVHGVEARMVTREGAERVFVSNVSPIGDGGAPATSGVRSAARNSPGSACPAT